MLVWHRLRRAWLQRAWERAAMDAGLKERADDPVQAGLDAAHKQVGKLSMKVKLLRAKIERLEGGRPLPRLPRHCSCQ